MDAKVIWSSGLSFTGSALSGFTLPLGAHPDVGGDNDGFRPMELIAIGIVGCTAMDVISILQKMKQDIREFSVEVKADQAEEHPKVFTKIQIHYKLAGVDVDEERVQRAIELSETRYCPAQAMFNQILPIELSYEIKDT
jgi:putative redox protein